MQISGVQGVAALSPEWATSDRQLKSASASSPEASLPTPSTQSSHSDSFSPASSSSPTEDTAKTAHGSTVVASYSPSVNGTHYLASVEYLDGSFVASVPAPPGFSATGMSVQEAEANLEIELDTLA